MPCIDAGNGFTVITTDWVQPVPMVKVTVAVLWVATGPPVTIPPEVIVATAELLLLHTPPTPSLNVVVWPAQIVVLPDMTVGNGLTVTVFTAVQPVAVSEYVITAVCAVAG
jgi:hypothetical protein